MLRGSPYRDNIAPLSGQNPVSKLEKIMLSYCGQSHDESLIRAANDRPIHMKLGLPPVASMCVDQLPKDGAMVVVLEAGKFMDQHVVDAGTGRFDQVQVQDDVACRSVRRQGSWNQWQVKLTQRQPGSSGWFAYAAWCL